MGKIKVYNFCQEKAEKTLRQIYKELKKTECKIINQYDKKEEINRAYIERPEYFEYSRYVRCCKSHKYLPDVSEVTTTIEYNIL